MKAGRAFVLLLDSLGVGSSADAGPDAGADTLGNIALRCASGEADQNGGRSGSLKIPNMMSLGLGEAYRASTGKPLAGVKQPETIVGAYGFAIEQSVGKDTPSGHWELMGVPVMEAWGTFSGEPCFPAALIDDLIEQAELPGVLGECAASGTKIIADLGEEHIRTGKPIVYTSADSVFQIAAHEEHFGLEKLYHVCDIARKLVDKHRVGRVIARPFVGQSAVDFVRTSNRRDWTTPPHDDTLFDLLDCAGQAVLAVGKTADIFAHQGVTESIKASGIDGLCDASMALLERAPAGSLSFVNFVDFDSHYGHRRDVIGYATALELFDQRLGLFLSAMQPNDLGVITADHGCDPTWPGSDHTREHIPVVLFGPTVQPGPIGGRETFADVGQTLAKFLGVGPLKYGKVIEQGVA